MVLITYLLANAIAIEEGQFTAEHLSDAQEIWLTNSVIGIWPVRAINSQSYLPGPVTRKVQSAWQQARIQQLLC